MILMIDNYDSFVYNLMMYFRELGEEVDIRYNDAVSIQEIESIQYKGIVLSPGPKTPVHAGICLSAIETFKNRIPILGICLGHQCIGQYFGMPIVRCQKPMHGKISTITHTGRDLFQGIPSPIQVTRYHSLELSDTSISPLNVCARSQEGSIMAVRHERYPIYGVQFHPEAYLTQYGHKMLENFLKICQEKSDA